jgi:hypothetical protein
MLYASGHVILLFKKKKWFKTMSLASVFLTEEIAMAYVSSLLMKWPWNSKPPSTSTCHELLITGDVRSTRDRPEVLIN